MKIGDLVEIKSEIEHESSMTARFAGCIGLIISLPTSEERCWYAVYLIDREKQFFFNSSELRILD